MILKVETSFRLGNITKAVQIYMSLDRLPDHIQLTGPYFQMTEDKKIRTLAFYKIEPDQYAETHDYLRKRYECFASLPEFRFTVEKWDEYQDALKRLGVI